MVGAVWYPCWPEKEKADISDTDSSLSSAVKHGKATATAELPPGAKERRENILHAVSQHKGRPSGLVYEKFPSLCTDNRGFFFFSLPPIFHFVPVIMRAIEFFFKPLQTNNVWCKLKWKTLLLSVFKDFISAGRRLQIKKMYQWAGSESNLFVSETHTHSLTSFLPLPQPSQPPPKTPTKRQPHIAQPSKSFEVAGSSQNVLTFQNSSLCS